MIYLNNAASSFPKPPGVNEALASYAIAEPFHPGRAGFEQQSKDVVSDCRERLARLLNADKARNIVFTSGATESLNLAIFGANLDGHVVTTAIEHNSVLRPLFKLQKDRGIEVTVVDCDENGYVGAEGISAAIRDNTSAVVVNHCSNVTGTVLDLDSISEVTRSSGILLIVDASQSAGAVPIDVQRQGVDLLVFAGHKSLYGVPGIGGLYIREDLRLDPLKVGGTGIRSDLLSQPEERPIYYEAGTANMLGIAALGAGVDFVLQHGVDTIHSRKRECVRRIVEAFGDMPEVRLYAREVAEQDSCVLSFNIEGTSPEDVGYMLENSFGITVRTGLHCAPLIHKALGSFPQGSIRVSPSYFTTEADVERLIEAIGAVVSVGCA